MELRLQKDGTYKLVKTDKSKRIDNLLLDDLMNFNANSVEVEESNSNLFINI